MNKKLFGILIALMTLSLLGIISVQVYWIVNAYQTKEEQFTLNVRQALVSVAKEIQHRETDYWYTLTNTLADHADKPDNIKLSELIYTIYDEDNTETYIFQDGVLEENYKLNSDFLDSTTDSIEFKKLTNSKIVTKHHSSLDGSQTQSIDEVFEKLDRLRDYERKQIEEAFSNMLAKKPIHQRVSTEELEQVIKEELDALSVRTSYDFAIFDDNLATNVRSEGFYMDAEKTYKVPLFVNKTMKTNYELFVNFPEKGKEVLGSMIGMIVLTIVFTAVILLTYGSALSQIFKQRQIDQIKTDFINNMTHELKTPIATINLALDALKNPRVRSNEEFRQKYLDMVREENKRMLAQVENVLRISKLEKNELELPKDKLELHDLIQNAISHIELIVEDRGGYIQTHFGALQSGVLANESHMTNVFINILDNAVKYSEDTPKIDIYTENIKDYIIVKIRDQGIGMNKQTLDKIFDKFYREPSGDIHNVKGHGLGLAYVQSVLEEHDATIEVDSEKNKGSTFILKLHLIS